MQARARHARRTQQQRAIGGAARTRQRDHADVGARADQARLVVERARHRNLCTRAMALEQLAKQPQEAATALTKAFESATDTKLRARLAWAAGMLPGQAEAWIARLAADKDERFRIIGVRCFKNEIFVELLNELEEGK